MAERILQSYGNKLPLRTLINLIVAEDDTIRIPAVYKVIDNNPSVFRKEDGIGIRKIVFLQKSPDHLKDGSNPCVDE